MILKEQDGDLVYSDGAAIEAQLLEFVREYPDEKAADAIAADSHYSINNTFSPVRHNLLSWYPFKPDADILEVGAGMGALTGFLCDVGGSVTAVEMNAARADVIRARFESRKNLVTMSENVLTWNTAQRFDYIVVVGVLEYAGIFSSGSGAAPHVAFMEALRRLLKPDGVVLLAIENRFGLKYWLGGAEDHLQEAFAGIRGYAPGGPQTFTKHALSHLLADAGLGAQRFYYVLPDYKFPTAVFTDSFLPNAQALQNIAYTYSAGSTLVANERDLYADILDSGMFAEMANAYLVEAGPASIPAAYVAGVSARGECKPNYRVVTAIHSDGTVTKKAADARAVAHVAHTYKNGLALRARGVRHIDGDYTGGVLKTDLCTAPAADKVFADAMLRGDWATAKHMIDALSDAILKSSAETGTPTALLGTAELPDAADIGPYLEHGYMDLTLYNAFWDDGALLFYDQEWDFPGLPLKFILYYGLKITYQRNCSGASIPFSEVMRYIDVPAALAAAFDALEGAVWAGVFHRLGDVYGADGYCNLYSSDMTYRHKMELLQSTQEQLQSTREQLQGQLSEREKHITILKAEVEEHLRERDEQALDAALARDEIRHLEEVSANLRGTVAHYDARLAQVLTSRTWRFGNKLATMLRKVFRPGSRLTRAVSAPLRGAVNLLRRLRANRAAHTSYVPLAIPAAPLPVVSIILPVYNEFQYTYHCIERVINTCANIAYEVILADDCSTDRTKKAGKLIAGLRIVRNEQNLRFLRNCNHAATQARGQYLVFLNNDTTVCENWLQSLLNLMEADPAIAVCGSKLLSANGTLQEAGGIIWNDASGWNYGRGADPAASEYNYVKEVDYVSGCSLMVRRGFWDEVGGFDERFAPAYYEDTDLAFTARAHGYKVVYQPLSVLTHFEGVSNGTDLEAGQKQHQVASREKFRKKWADVLEQEQYPPEQQFMRARDRTKNKKIVLLVDHYIPTYDQDAGSRSIYSYIKLFLADGWHVILLPDNCHRSEYAEHYEQLGVEVLYGDWYYLHWQEWLAENGGLFDLVFLHRPHISIKYIDAVKQHCRAKVLYYGADLHFLREQRQYEVTGDESLLESSEKWRKIELNLMRAADCALYPSMAEEAYINALDPKINIRTLPIYVLPQPERARYDIENRNDLLFVGGFNHPPNADAVLWFIEEVFPGILAKYPNMVFHIVGSKPPEEIKLLAGRNVVVHGFVSDERLAQFYRECRLSVVPLRYGAGMKGKVIEALAYGMPVVTTSIGAEGIDPEADAVAVADEADDFTGMVCKLYDGEEQLAALRAHGYDYIEANLSAAAAWRILNEAMGGEGGPQPSGG